ncbi:MAG: nucleotidyltransferase family protein [Myxococcaceae bacterium]
MLALFQQLSSFAPPRQSLKQAPWDAYVPWAIGNGLAPLAAYNLEYRLAGADAPEWARDRLLSVYQGALSDNVMKLVNFKRSVSALEGRRVLLLGAASFVEVLYPHVGFRPVADIELLLAPGDVEGFANFMGQNHFRFDAKLASALSATAAVSDGRTAVALNSGLLGKGREKAERDIFERALPAPVYGSSFFRPDLEDALLLACLDAARRGFEIPFVAYIDIRELVKGALSLGGVYARPQNASVLKTRARACRLERATFVALAITSRLFPELRDVIESLSPSLPRATRAVLERAIVDPVSKLGQMRLAKGMGRLRQVLTGTRA